MVPAPEGPKLEDDENSDVELAYSKEIVEAGVDPREDPCANNPYLPTVVSVGRDGAIVTSPGVHLSKEQIEQLSGRASDVRKGDCQTPTSNGQAHEKSVAQCEELATEQAKEEILITPQATEQAKEEILVTPQATEQAKEEILITPQATEQAKEEILVTPQATEQAKEEILATEQAKEEILVAPQESTNATSVAPAAASQSTNEKVVAVGDQKDDRPAALSSVKFLSPAMQRDVVKKVQPAEEEPSESNSKQAKPKAKAKPRGRPPKQDAGAKSEKRVASAEGAEEANAAGKPKGRGRKCKEPTLPEAEAARPKDKVCGEEAASNGTGRKPGRKAATAKAEAAAEPEPKRKAKGSGKGDDASTGVEAPQDADDKSGKRKRPTKRDSDGDCKTPSNSRQAAAKAKAKPEPGAKAAKTSSIREKRSAPDGAAAAGENEVDPLGIAAQVMAKKKLRSFQSSAYHAAAKQARDAGLDEDKCKEAAKAVSRLYNFACATVFQLNEFPA